MVLCTLAMIGWWGFFYPQLSVTPDTVRIVTKEDEVLQEWDFDGELAEDFLKADREQVRYKSKLLEFLKRYFFR